MNQNNRPQYVEETELSLKDLIELFQSYFREIISNWKLIPLIVLPIAGYLLFVAHMTLPTYQAELTFMINDDEEQSQGLANIIGMFGGGPGAEYNLDKIMVLSKSRRIIHQTLFKRATVDGHEDYYANHIIREYKYNEDEWDMETPFHFTHDSIPGFNKTERYALKCIYEEVVGFPKWNVAGLLSGEINESTGIMVLSVKTTSEELSISLTNAIYQDLSKYYVEKTIEKQKQTYEVMSNQKDSLHKVLSKKEYALANFIQTSRGLWPETQRLEQARLTRDVEMLTRIFGEAVVNLEVAEFALLNKTPFVILIDEPIFPIYPNRKSKVQALIIAIFIGTFLGIAFLVGRKIITDAMNGGEPQVKLQKERQSVET